MTPEQLKSYQEQKAERFAKLALVSKNKVAQWIPLWTGDICPFCEKNIWYYCKSWCVVTGQKL